MSLVLSLFPGIGLLDAAFELEGFCIVRGPDVIWGGDVRNFHPPAGRFDGVIGGPPCQSFSRLAHMVRANGYEPKFGNLIPEFERCIEATRPQWFLMEEVPDAPLPNVEGYANHYFTINNRQCLEEDGEPAIQNRVRAITFGWRGEFRPLMVETSLFQSQTFAYAACGGGHGEGRISRENVTRDPRALARKRGVPVALGGSGLEKPAVRRERSRLNECVGDNIKSWKSFRRLCTLQGLPPDFELPAFTVGAACKAVGNGVPRAMGLALAKAVREATQQG